MTEETLSDKIIHSPILDREAKETSVKNSVKISTFASFISEKDVKSFIKKLKEEIDAKREKNTNNSVLELIDTLAGKELVE